MRRNRASIALTLASVVAFAEASGACRGARESAGGRGEAAIVELGDGEQAVERMKRAFEADRARVRLLVLASPT